MRKIMSVLLALAILAAGNINVTCGFFGGLAGKAVAIAEETVPSTVEATAPSTPTPKAEAIDKDTKTTTEETKAPNSVEITSETTVTPENHEDDNVTENPNLGGATTPEVEEASVEEPSEEPGVNATENPALEVVPPPSFSLSGEIDATWLKHWSKGEKDGVRLQYVVSASAYVPEYSAVYIKTFGLKEARALREGETGNDLRHDISSSGRAHSFGKDNLSSKETYTIPESALRAVKEGTYEVYAVYLTADGQEKIAVFGAITLKKIEEPSNAAVDGESPEVVSVRKVELEAWVEGQDDAQVLVLSAKLSGFENDTIESLQWQFDSGAGWVDARGANGLMHRAELNEETAQHQWRLKVIVVGDSDVKEPEQLADAAVAEGVPSEE